MELPEGMALPVIRDAKTRDAFGSNHYDSLMGLPEGARLGTSSLRRQSQAMANRPDLKVSSLRGNVQTRLGKLDAGEFDAIILASAGLKRLEMHERIRYDMPPEESLPAVGQGPWALSAARTTPTPGPAGAAQRRPDLGPGHRRAGHEPPPGRLPVPIAGLRCSRMTAGCGRAAWWPARTAPRCCAPRLAPRADARALGIGIAESLLEQGADRSARAVRPRMSRAVVVTRPPARASPGGAAGGQRLRAWVVPVLIEPLPLADAHRRLLFDLDLYHAVFFVSANAAHHALNAFADLWPQWPVGVHWLAVGESTAAVIRDAGLTPEYPRSGFNSEAVLALPCLASVAAVFGCRATAAATGWRRGCRKKAPAWTWCRSTSARPRPAATGPKAPIR